MVKVQYASPRTAHTGSGCHCLHRFIDIRAPEIIVAAILLESVKGIFAFTPLPRPSASTMVVKFPLRNLHLYPRRLPFAVFEQAFITELIYTLIFALLNIIFSLVSASFVSAVVSPRETRDLLCHNAFVC